MASSQSWTESLSIRHKRRKGKPMDISVLTYHSDPDSKSEYVDGMKRRRCSSTSMDQKERASMTYRTWTPGLCVATMLQWSWRNGCLYRWSKLVINTQVQAWNAIKSINMRLAIRSHIPWRRQRRCSHRKDLCLNNRKRLFEFVHSQAGTKATARVVVKKVALKEMLILNWSPNQEQGFACKVYKDTTSLEFADGETKTVGFQPLILREKRPMSVTLKSNCSIGSRKPGQLYSVRSKW